MTQTEWTADSRTTGQVVIATYDNYADAERAVDHLSGEGFPVERTAIAGRGLTLVEQVTGRLSLGRAALQSGVSGAVMGGLLAWLFGFFNWVTPLVSLLLLVLYGVLFGAVAGALMGMAGHVLSGRRRDFASVAAMQAERYQILVESDAADEAMRLLEAGGLAGRV
ncbi:glycine zipper family protein [Catellatospora sp. KI3]|uniref:general stress protein n=1 Tax=Catellatospora sp. KI3 TaxID=3041620 RepID=UPI0024822488|nr:general stress protein [Catellatospora sp. KI3]MDI1463400.1 glycine zipper family protein [Catellatospora sp. KI3]